MRLGLIGIGICSLMLSGCTMASLERSTLAQTNSVVSLRTQQVVDNLALLADDPTALPFYSSIFSGSAQLTDTEQIGATTIWQHLKGANGFASQNGNPQFSRQWFQNWTLDPIVHPEKLEALRYACWWFIYGPQSLTREGLSLLSRPDQLPQGTPGRHFGVMDRLVRMPTHWLRIGKRHDVPMAAQYKARSGDVWVWIMPQDLQGLSDLSLIFQDIARVSINSPTLFCPVPLPATWTFNAADTPTTPQSFPNVAQVQITVALNRQGQLAPDTPYYRQRLESLGTDTSLRSQINAAGASH